MYFVLEESSWVWDGEDVGMLVERIEQLLDRIDDAKSRGERVSASRELLGQSVAGVPLGELFWATDRRVLTREVRERLVPVFNAISFWDDLEPFEEFEATIAGRDVVSPSAVHVHACVRRGETVACLPLPGTWAGPCSVRVRDEPELIHFVVDDATHRGFFRSAVVACKHELRAIEALAPHAFPDTCFIDGVWRDARHFDGGYPRVRDSLLAFLSILDDHGAWVFTDQTGRLSPGEPTSVGDPRIAVTRGLIERRFRGFGLEVAPENPDVGKDAECRRARTRRLGAQQLYCEWHYKIERHVNRVHIHEPTPASNGKVIVAIFADHLPLPGD
jgi:hypothetical protein